MDENQQTETNGQKTTDEKQWKNTDERKPTDKNATPQPLKFGGGVRGQTLDGSNQPALDPALAIARHPPMRATSTMQSASIHLMPIFK